MADQTVPQTRQPANSYPSTHSYPEPSMQPSYTYPPPQGQTNPEPYRGSPQGSNMSLPSINLPPIRIPDGQAQQQQQQQQQQQPPQPQPGQPAMSSPLPPPGNSLPQYYAHPGHPPPPGQPLGITPSPHNPNLAMRYQLPPNQEPRMMSGGRHKKEIKRRTKTGCLTCRKRRIKCDEAHPICRNCTKSKRECLGYDPIFKQQPGPAQIQPAPSAAPHQNSIPASAPPTSLPYGAQVPQGYAPAVSAGYTPPASAVSTHPPYQSTINSVIDPALAAADPAMQGQPPYNGTHAANPALKGTSPYSSPSEGQIIKAKPIRIDELYAIGGHQPPPIPERSTPIEARVDEEIRQIFTKDYATGLDSILESKWFSANGLAKIFLDKDLHEEFAFFADTVSDQSSAMMERMARIFGQEARLIWHMLSICRSESASTNGTNGTTSSDAETMDLSLLEVRARLDILEALLTNQVLKSNPVSELPYPADIVEAKRHELEFWKQLGNFVLHADNDSAPPGAVDDALHILRQVLQQIEARDVLYSIAIARHTGAKTPNFPQNIPPPPPNQDPENDLTKLDIAMRFLSHEARASQQQVIARICDMAQHSWHISRFRVVQPTVTHTMIG